MNHYLIINFSNVGGSGACSQTPSGANYNTRYCGQRLTPVISGQQNIPICGVYWNYRILNLFPIYNLLILFSDCTTPFTVYIVSDSGADTGIAGTGAVTRGVCLDYFQIPC